MSAATACRPASGGRMMVEETASWHVRAVISRLRAADWVEIRAVEPDAGIEGLVDRWLAILPHAAYRATYRTSTGAPAAILAVVPYQGRAGIANLLATDLFAPIGLDATRHMLDVVKPALIGVGYRRLEARVHEHHSHARRWLRHLGAVEECALGGMSVDGSNFIQVAWVATAEEVERCAGAY